VQGAGPTPLLLPQRWSHVLVLGDVRSLPWLLVLAMCDLSFDVASFCAHLKFARGAPRPGLLLTRCHAAIYSLLQCMDGYEDVGGKCVRAGTAGGAGGGAGAQHPAAAAKAAEKAKYDKMCQAQYPNSMYDGNGSGRLQAPLASSHHSSRMCFRDLCTAPFPRHVGVRVPRGIRRG